MVEISITGIGVVSALGVGCDAFWDSCRSAKSGIKKIAEFDADGMRANVAGWVDDFNPGAFMSPMTYRRMSRVSRMAVASSIEALQDSHIDMDAMDMERVAVIVGTSYGSSSHVDEFYLSLLNGGPRGAQPFLFPETVPNAPASHIAMFHNITGPNSTFCQNDISAESALFYAHNLLAQDAVDVVIVGGAEELSEILFTCYDAVGALSPIKAESGDPVSPRSAGGFVLGEGAAVLIMERKAYAKERGAKIYGNLAGMVINGGSSAMGHYAVDGEQLIRAMQLCLEKAGIEPAAIDHIDVSANFSKELDRMECECLYRLFGNVKDLLHLTPLKYLTGNFGAAGMTRAAALLLSMYHRTPLPTVHAKSLMPEREGELRWQTYPKAKIEHALMISSTFGGGNSCMIFSN